MNRIYFDSHAHLDNRKFNDDREEVIDSLPEKGVKYILNAGSDIPSSYTSAALAEKYSFIYASAGVHPHDAKDFTSEHIGEIEALAGRAKVVAIGEIGLDYYYDNSPRLIQRDIFERQMELAVKLDMPVIIHIRDAYGDAMDVLRKFKGRIKSGVLHCFSGSLEYAVEAIDMGYYISFGGPVTFKNARKALDVAAKIDINRLLIETDCPYLTPEPHRGKRNDPSNVRYVADRIGKLRNMTDVEIAIKTAENACQLYGIMDNDTK